MQIANLDIRLIKLMQTAVQRGYDETKTLDKLRDVIQGIPEFNVREKAKAYLITKKLYTLMTYQNGKLYNGQIKTFCIGMNKVNEKSRARARAGQLLADMRNHRATQGVFYLCSCHSNPAVGHAAYQGKIYVDRYWKSASMNDRRVAAYIKNHNLMTVQDVCQGPVYMTTRPYCKHFFIPLNTEEVLSCSVNKIRKNHPEGTVKNHNINYRKKFYKLRYRIHNVLGMQAEATKDLKLIARYK